MLGGGGVTGAVYEIGALRALDLVTVGEGINDFDIYVGTSAGAFVSAMVANGVTPDEMLRTVIGDGGPASFPALNMGTLISPNYRGYLTQLAKLPWRSVSMARKVVRNWPGVSLLDLAVGLSENLPAGLYHGRGVERYLRESLATGGRTNDFRQLGKELYITATDLDSTERVVLGGEGWADVPISKAVEASTALPMVYKPVAVRDRDLVDGGIVSTTNLDVAVEAGAKMIIVVNPVAPFVNDFSKRIPTAYGKQAKRVSEMGFAHIGYQSFKLLAHNRLHESVKRWEAKYPGVDIVLIEPEFDDELMFGTNIMSYSERVAIARHGFGSVTLKLARDYKHLQAVAERHGLAISPKRLDRVVKHFRGEGGDTDAWKTILEQDTDIVLSEAEIA